MTENDLCPTCGRPYRIPSRQAGRRVCSLCGYKIGRYDKWEFGPDSRAQHKSCKNARGKIDTNEPKGLF
jgi:hypothetical protein